MASDTEALKRDIEHTRDELGTTLEAIGDRVAPKKVVGRVKENVSEKVEDVKDKVSPVRLAKRKAGDLRRRSSSNGTAERAVPARSRRAIGAGSTASPRRSARSAVELTETTDGQGGGAVARVRSAPSTIKQTAQDNPLATAVVAFGGGFLLASVLPRTEKEQALTERARTRIEPVKERALEAGRGVAEELKGMAEEGFTEIKQRATDAAAQVKTEALALAEQVKENARTSADTVKEEAAGASTQVKRQAQAATARVKGETSAAKPATGTRPARSRTSSPGTGTTRRRRTTTATSG